MKFFTLNTSLKSYDLALNSGLATAIVCVAILFYAGIFQPIQTHILQIQGRSSELKELISQTSRISVQREKLHHELTAEQDRLEQLEARLPSAARESDFLTQVCELAASKDLQIADYQPGSVSARETHHELEVRISLRGDYSAVCQFLRQSDELPRLCRLVQLEVTSPQTGQVLTADLTYRIYFSPQQLKIASQDLFP